MTPNGLRAPGYCSASSRPASSRDVEPDGDWTTVRVPVESLDHAVVDLLRLGPEVEVLEPPELRERVIARIAAMARRLPAVNVLRLHV